MKALGILGVALLAVLALTFVSAASAAKLQIEGISGPFSVEGAQVASENHVLTLDGSEVKCKKATFKGSALSPTETLNLTPSYSECTAFGFVGATVTTTGCDYRFTIALLVIGEPGFAALYDLLCAGTNKIRISAGTCEVEIPAQEGIKGWRGTNQATSPKTALIETSAANLHYNKTKDGFLCPLSGTGEKFNGTYTGTTLLKAFEGGSQRGVFFE